ncbi:hypothetical protein HO939_01610 [Streptococcus suis]|uniref:Membrane protein n=1 Tax=Streptococcus suis TaxID=1307 RepID=A0A0Z8J5G4_STRSU|nr:hypothetical protein [Streptococcus suis]NQG70875.1 hypothetical protein [Streptococcus suis]NQP04182.1 hypothetical protein [Streptococcus suis]CYV47698.1 membrane protein [Streptococcus suis]HEL1731286.1 hypothetical protein [Streptococcus suis]HEM5463140.1 hypothetical protein [Streptococcus suis]
MKTNLLKTAGIVATCVRYFFYFTIALYTIFTLAGLGGDSFAIGSWEYSFNKPIDQISVWLILLTSGLILIILAVLSHISHLIQKLCKLLLEEDYFASASLELYQKLFISLLVLTAGQFCLTSLIVLTNAAGPNNFLNLRWSDFILNALFICLTYFVWTLVQKGQQLETENSEFI